MVCRVIVEKEVHGGHLDIGKLTPSIRKIRVFLCYRRTDGAWHAEWLYRHLKDASFKDASGQACHLDVYYDKTAPGVSDWKQHHFPSLQASQAIILVCTTGIATDFSKRAQPDWVYEELRWWSRHRNTAPIVVDATREGDRWLPKLITRKWPSINRIDLNKDDAAAAEGTDMDFAPRIRKRIIGISAPILAEITIRKSQEITMGILFHDAKMLLDAKVKGASFEQTLTVGHLSLYLHDKEVKKLSEFYAIAFPNIGKTLTTDYRFGDYSDFLFREFLRASALSIIDYSSYEGADIVHDLNQPVPDSLHDNFDAVVDGGSLEHIFNFPIAISNLMNMVKTGGSLFISTPANNLCGHGFYQFSPELMFRVFTEENGFELKRIMLVEAKFPSVELAAQPLAYDVVDPAVVFERVGLMSRHPVIMMIHAKKTRELSLFTNPPLQSDYVTLWKGSHVEKRGSSILRTVLKKISRTVPKAVQTRINGYHQIKHFSFANRKFYRRRSLESHSNSQQGKA